jgi:hypothetical protein
MDIRAQLLQRWQPTIAPVAIAQPFATVATNTALALA